MKLKNIIYIILMLILASLVMATELVPQGDVNGKGVRKIYNFTNVSADRFCDDTGYCKTILEINESYNDTELSDRITTETANRISNDSLLDSKIDAVNTSDNIRSFITAVFLRTLGFNTTTELKNYFDDLYMGVSYITTIQNWILDNTTKLEADDVLIRTSIEDNITAYNSTIGEIINYTSDSDNFSIDSGTKVISWLIDIPTKLSELVNDASFLTQSVIISMIDGNWSDLEDRKLNITDQRFNDTWDVGDDYATFDGSTWFFNQSKLTTIYYNASSLHIVTGTGAGTLAKIQTYDGITYNVTETNSDYELLVNFTGISEFTTLLVRHKTDVIDGHVATIQIWDYDGSRWEGYGFVTESTTSEMQTFGIYNADKHISGGTVQVRFHQVETGNSAHAHQFDWVSLSKGLGTPVGQEVDPLSIRIDGKTPLTGDWNAGNYTINASSFNGDWNGSVGYLKLADMFGGDVSGTYDALQVETTQGLSGENITDGTVADVRIASTIARDSELVAFIENKTDVEFADVNITGVQTHGEQWENTTHRCIDYPTLAHCEHWNGTHRITT